MFPGRAIFGVDALGAIPDGHSSEQLNSYNSPTSKLARRVGVVTMSVFRERALTSDRSPQLQDRASQFRIIQLRWTRLTCHASKGGP
jgi:hypothetical protein